MKIGFRKSGFIDQFNGPKDGSDIACFKLCKLPIETQVEIFRFALDRLSPPAVPALCKEDASLWNALGMEFKGCHCPHGAADALVAGRTGAPFAL